MNDLTKKRLKAMLIDMAVSSAVSAALEPLVKKKVKSDFVPNVIMPSVVLWGLEAAEIGLAGQTLGQKTMGIKIVTKDGGKPTTCQLLKRAMYRDSFSSISYLKDRKSFEENGGAVFPHDRYAGTLAKEL